MLLKIQNVMDATLLISLIIRERRAMPQIGKYKLARMHAKLLPEFVAINESRDEMIKSYGYHQTVTDEQGAVTETAEWAVPNEKVDEFNAAWLELAQQEITIDIDPISIADVDLGPGTDGPIEASEFIAFGALFLG